MFRFEIFRKTSALAAAVLALGLAVLPSSSAEARYYRNGHLWGGLAAGALIGGALAAPQFYGPGPAYITSGPVYIDEPECYFVRERVWDDYRGRWVRVKRRVCE